MGLLSFFSKDRELNYDVQNVPKNQILSQPLDTFKSEKFETASIQERMSAYQNLENYMANKQGRVPRQVVFDNERSLPFNENGIMPNGCGYYTAADDKIHMNPYYLTDACARSGNQFDGMDTVIHEGRHAYHNDCMYGEISNPDETYLKNSAAIDKSYYNGVYNEAQSIDALTGWTNYHNIPCEQDTHHYAYDTMSGEPFASEFANDKNYNNYVAAQKNYLQNAENEAYANEAVNNMLNNNPEFAEQHSKNIQSGMNIQTSLRDAYNQTTDGEFVDDFNSEINNLKSQTPPNEFSSDYINKVADEYNNEKPLQSDAQKATQIHNGDYDYAPVADNYSNVSENSRDGFQFENQNGGFYNSNATIAKQNGWQNSDDTSYNPADKSYENEALLKDEIVDYDSQNDIADGNKYMSYEDESGYAPTHSYGRDSNNYLPSDEYVYNEDDLNQIQKQEDLDVPEEQNNDSLMHGASEEDGVKPDNEQGNQNQNDTNAMYDAVEEDGVRPDNEQGNQNQNDTNAMYDAVEEDGVKPDNEQGNQSRNDTNAMYDAVEEDGVKPDNEQDNQKQIDNSPDFDNAGNQNAGDSRVDESLSDSNSMSM